MSIFPFVLPTTGPLSLAGTFRSAENHNVILNADASRALVRDCLKRAKRGETGDNLAVSKAIEEYLPLLFSLKDGLVIGAIQQVSPFKSTWGLPLSTSRQLIQVIEPPKVAVNSLDNEIRMTLLTYALASMVLADNETRDTSRKIELQYKLATSLLQRAESVLMYLSAHALSNPTDPDEASLTDLRSESVNMLLNIVTGALHRLVLTKYVAENSYKGQAETKFPETARGVSSMGLMMRISIYASSKFGAALQLKSGSSKLGSNDLKEWLEGCRGYCDALTQLLMGIELNNKGEAGHSIRLLRDALDSLGSSPAKIKSFIKKNSSSPEDPSHENLRIIISEHLKNYENQNNKYGFDSIPKKNEWKPVWPSGREVFPIQAPWVPPRSDFFTPSGVQTNEYF